MKKALVLVLIAVFAVAVAMPVYAGDMGEKAKGGFETFFKSPMQVKDHIEAEYEASEFKPFGILGGLFKGTFYFGKDLVTGLVDVLTSPVELTKD